MKCALEHDGYISPIISGIGNIPREFVTFNDLGFRPRTIVGIEHNNGWIRIESEEDLPKESGLYFILDEDDNIIHSEFEINFGQFFTKDFTYDHYELTHYQPIVKPEKPIY